MNQVVKGVLYLHSHGIIHRDLTLGNIFLTREMDAVSVYDLGTLNPFIPMSDQCINSPYNFNTLSNRQVMRTKTIIN